ncbi:MAG: RidA family protein [Atribacterota bacterium]|nr:RidA family protein [Atribacterota bacterium]MDD5497250.1 RidA family protein [Atribacterota bacterium]
MRKEILINEEAPKAIGPYSPAIKVGNLVFISGQLPVDSATGEIVGDDIEIQTKKSLENLKAVLKPYSIDFENVVKVTIFLTNMDDFSKVNKVYSDYFKEEFPARSCVEVARLPKGAKIEIECIAII